MDIDIFFVASMRRTDGTAGHTRNLCTEWIGGLNVEI